jgi:hypothetical protein
MGDGAGAGVAGLAGGAGAAAFMSAGGTLLLATFVLLLLYP